MMKNKQSGSMFVVVVIALSIAILGVGGYIVWQNFGQTKKANSSVSTQADSTKADTATREKSIGVNNSTDAANKTADDGVVADDSSANYFVIDFWKIKGVYSSSHYLSYEIPSAKLLVFSSKELPASCAEGVGRLQRYMADDEVSLGSTYDGNPKKASEIFAKDSITSTGGNRKVGDYYYTLSTPMQYCIEDGAESLQKAIFVDVLKYFKTLKAE